MHKSPRRRIYIRIGGIQDRTDPAFRTVPLRGIDSVPRLSRGLFRVLLHRLWSDLRAVDVPLRVDGDALRGARAGGRLGRVRILRVRNEIHHLQILRAPDTDAALPSAGMRRRARLRVGGVEAIVLVDEQSADAAEILRLGEELAVEIEELEPDVAAIGDEEPAARVDGEAVRRAELAGSRAELSPALDEFAVPGALPNARD